MRDKLLDVTPSPCRPWMLADRLQRHTTHTRSSDNEPPSEFAMTCHPCRDLALHMPKAPRQLPSLPRGRTQGWIKLGSKAIASQPVDHPVKRSGAIGPGRLPGFSLAQRQTKASPRGSERGFLAGGLRFGGNLKHRSCRCAEGSRKILRRVGPACRFEQRRRA